MICRLMLNLHCVADVGIDATHPASTNGTITSIYWAKTIGTAQQTTGLRDIDTQDISYYQ